MTTPVRIATVLAAVGALVLCVLGFTSALEGAGPFKNLLPVKVGLVLGVLPAYFIALWVAAWSAGRATRFSQGRWRFATLAVIAVTAAAATFFAPLLPSASLAALCLSQALCPEAANPVLWSYLHLVTSLPAMPIVVGLAVVIAAANTPIRSASNNEA